MAVLPIRLYPDPVLRSKAEPVTEFDDALRKLTGDMTDTMREAPGVGLAAVQVGVVRRVVVYEWDELGGALVNPVVVEKKGRTVDEEACLSIPDMAYPVPRAQWVRVEALDESGMPFSIEAEDHLARILQHEVDHLDGVLYLDRIEPPHRREALRALRERTLTLS